MLKLWKLWLGDNFLVVLHSPDPLGRLKRSTDHRGQSQISLDYGFLLDRSMDSDCDACD